MDIQTKVNSHNRLLKAVRQNLDISNVVVPENSDNYEFSCTICGSISMEFNLRGTTDLLIVKAEAEIKNKTEQEIYEIGSEITENTNVRFTSYENKLVFQNVVPLIKLEGIEGEKKIFNETMSFIQLMISHKDQLGCEQESRSYVDMDFTGSEEEDDPFGFNDFDNNPQSSNKEVFNSGFDVEPPVQTMPQKENITPPSNNGFEEDLGGAFDGFSGGAFDGFDTSDGEFDDFLNNNDENNIELNLYKDEENEPEPTPPPAPIPTPQPQPKVKNQPKLSTKPTPKQPTIPQMPQVDNGFNFDEDDGLSDMISSLEVAEKKQKEKRKKDNPITSTSPIGGGIQFKPKKPVVDDEDELDNNFSVASQNVSKKEKREKKKQNQQVKQNLKNNDEEKDIVMQTTVDYKRAPEVVEQMKHLYAEMDQLFAQRKKQADYREETLNKFSERLDKREKELAIRAERIEQNFNDSKAQLAKTTEDFETQKKEIEFQWNKLKMEQEMLETQKRDIEERELLVGRMNSLDDSNNLEEEVDSLNEQVRMLESQVEEYRTKLASITEEYEAKIDELNEDLSMAESDMSLVEKQALEEEIRSLNEKIEDLNDEISDLNEDINEINDVSAQKDQIIQSFKDRQESWKSKESAYKAQLANVASNAGANEEIMQENADLQEKLTSAIAQARSALDRASKLENENKRLKTIAMNQQSSNNNSNAEDTETINRLTQELAQANAQLNRANAAYDELKSQVDLNNANNFNRGDNGTVVDNKQLARNAQEGLGQIGIQTEIVPGAGELMLSGYSDECQIVVNIDAGILYVEKPVKRGVKYKADIEKWNQEDIRASYMFTDKKVMCKTVYVDVSKSAMDILGRFSKIS